MSSDAVAKTVGKKLRYYFEVKRLEDGFDLSGVNAPKLNHPPLKSLPYHLQQLYKGMHPPLVPRPSSGEQRPTLQYDGLHDRALKHYFSEADVKTRLTQLMPKDTDPKEDDVKRLLKRYMYKYRFISQRRENRKEEKQLQVNKPQKLVGYNRKNKPVSPGNFPGGNSVEKPRPGWVDICTPAENNKHPTMPQWMYKHHPTRGKAVKSEYVGFGVGLKSQKHKSLKGGYPLMRTVPSNNVGKKEAHRLIDVATKILVATEKVNELQTRAPSPPPRQTAPKPFETNKPLPTSGDGKKKRPSTAKYTWDIHGRRHVRVRDGETHSDDSERPSSASEARGRRAMDDSFIPDWLLKQQSDRPRSPEPKRSPRPKSAKYRQRSSSPPPHRHTVINVPERDTDREDVTVNEGTQTAGDNVGIQTEKRLLEEYDHTEDEVTTGPWAEYQVYVRTGARVGSSTRADVRITLYGEKGRSKELLLDKSSRNKVKFQSGKEDVFLLPAHHVGRLRKIKIGHDRRELRYAWYVEGVSVYDMNDKRIYDFECDSWMSGTQGDGKTYRDYHVDHERAFVEAFDDVKGRQSPKAGKDRRKKDDSSESRASRDDKRSLESLKGSRGDDSDTSTTSYTSSSSGSSENRRRKGRKSKSPPRSPKARELSPPRQAKKDDFFDKKSGPTFTFRSYSNDGNTAEEEYMHGYKDGLDASSSEQKQGHKAEDDRRKKLLEGATIFDAARTGDLERMQELINYFPDMKESKDETGLTSLHIATQQGRLDIVKWLTACNINLNTETSTGYTAIHLAAMNGHLNCMIVLAAMGATLTCRSVDRQTPLHVASMNGHLECVKWLIANRSSLEAEDQLGRTPLELAEEYRHEATADFLRRCLDEARDPDSSLHALRSSNRKEYFEGTADLLRLRLDEADSSLHALRSSNRKELHTIEEDSNRESKQDQLWHNDSKGDSSRANFGSESEGRKSQDTRALKERRRVYDEQHNRMEKSGQSFLDSIRDEI